MIGVGIDLTSAVRRPLSGGGTPALPVISLSTTAVSHAEGNSGSTAYTYTVARSGDLSGASSATWTVAGSSGSPADAADFVGGVLPTGTVSFAAGASSATITVNVAGDSTVEPDEGFTVTLSSPVNATLGTASATGTITNDDAGGTTPTITGSTIEGSALTTDAASPQWQRGAGTLFYDIPGETGATFTPNYASVGVAVRVRDTVSGLASAATAAVAEGPILFDSFTEAGTGTASIAGHQADVGGLWAQHPSGVAGVSIDRDADRAVGTVTSGANYFINDKQLAATRLRINTKMQLSSGIVSFLAGFSKAGALDGYRFYHDSTTWTLQRYDANAVTTVHTTGFAAAVGSSEFVLDVTLEDLGDRTRLSYFGPLHDRANIVQADDTSANRKLLTGGYMGIGPRTGNYLDDFKVLQMDDTPVVSADACWTWYNDPRAIYHGAVDYVAYVDKSGTIRLTKRAAGVDTTVSVGVANNPVDDHNNAGMCVLPGGRLWIGYCDHTDAVGSRYRVSTNPLPDISAFSAERTIGLNGAVNVSYINPYILSDGVLRVIRRENGPSVIAYAPAADVEAGTEVWAFKTVSNLDHAYIKACASADNHRLYILFGTGHPDRTDTALYGAYLDVSSGSEVWRDLAGNAISLPLNDTNATLIRSSSAGGPNNWSWDVAEGADGHPRFLGTRFPGGQGAANTTLTNIEYWHYRWTGTAIVATQLAANQTSLYPGQPYYAGGMCFDSNDATAIYASTLDETGFYQVGEYRVDEATNTITKTRNVSSRALMHNCRPYSPRNHGTETAVYFWRGSYKSYLTYDTVLHRSK